MTPKTIYRDPGSGAIEFAKSFIRGLTEESALLVIKHLVAGTLHDKNDKRIKTCVYCNYFFRDQTRPGNAKACSSECKVGFDTLNRAKRRAEEALLKPKKKGRREEYYLSWFEYPFWLNEYEMIKQSWKQEAPYSPEKLAQIAAAKERQKLIGGKQKPKRCVPYKGDEKDSGKVFIHFPKHNYRKPSNIVVSNMSREEIDNYFCSRYSMEHLRLERQRAMNLATAKRYKGKE
ncbi:hypothetical protein QUF79_07550 [Fictibacillus enclensis]|uniref:hypothetical protein n=1 Tax=Fictibacillus enclensis TaxID=1017270 RepID=UPI0025A23549|nr:hypothetical protein [Fictibacillus enclensis]MDM5197868.1 hypothetical protein [Fictibacillus enclensis]